MDNSVTNVLKELGIDIQSDSLGVVVGKKTATPKPMKKAITNGDKEKALQMGVIPETLKNVEFDFDVIKSEILDRGIKEQYRVANFKEYQKVLSSIMFSIKAGTLPSRSWLIGAPKRFGKIEFVNDALKFMIKQDMKCVPYISLTELSDKKYERDTEIARNEAVKKVMKTAIFDEEKIFVTSDGREIRKPVKNITEMFGWQDYLSADIVFCFFTTVSNKEIESMTLKTLLDIRGSKGLPTIVFMDISLEAYTSNEKLKDWVWEPIIDNSDNNDEKNIERFSTVKHISTYQMKSSRNIEITEYDLKKDLDI